VKTDLIYLAFALLGLVAFRFARPAAAALGVFLVGWLVLPVGHFPDGAADVVFPYWITGLAVPSDMLLTKAWVAPVAALLGAAVFDHRSLQRFRPSWMDLPMALWCLWPLVQSIVVVDTSPSAWIAALYLAGCWAAPWMLGRLYFSSPEGWLMLAQGLALTTLACLPIGLIEGVLGPTLYGLFYEPHPFKTDGIERYIGFRPLGFFEDGNQYGLWISLCALAAIWLAVIGGKERSARIWRTLATVATALALAAQSVSGIGMLVIGTCFLSACRWIRPRQMAIAAAAALLLGGSVYVSGIVPIAKLGRDTSFGRHVVDSFRGIGRGSFTWRISQDQKLLPDAMARPITGHATWDWWRHKETRPWGLTVLVLGQFGLVGLALCLGTLLWPAIRIARQAPSASGWGPQGLSLMLATVVALTVLDALMNSFIFFPAIVIAGSLAAVAPGRRRGEITRIGRRS
jgi:hypothetical protein